ncbi:putative AFG1-family ATPase [Methylorubrum extorquens DM4]|uniref:AFG1-family ATPase n=1 Tax=Methylorubrum extorquens (strain DSM 6343 / CIP 106787 / DM4) TaxID=661410 RepID=C7CAU0_METED|nr:cell division protein ZapE [Methylorubrum extorquens]CAX24223.1 putative AFG1-family ATPase [Methylorubrum extorquens DM4]
MSTAFKTEFDQRVLERDIAPEPEQGAVIAALDRLSADIESPKRSLSLFHSSHDRAGIRGVYIWGRVGRGKSMLMNLFYDQAAESRKRRLHFHAFMAEVHAAMQPPAVGPDESRPGPADPIAAAADALLQRVRLLCVDELEVTDIADAMILGRLFDRLFQRGLILVATSNEDPDHLYDGGPNRELFEPFIERLKSHVQVVRLDGDHDHRSDGSDDDASRYLSPISKENTARFDRLWNTTINGNREISSSVRVHSRDVELSRTCGQHARVAFEEVCQRPMSADDHLAIAQQFTDVFLEGVPRIGREHGDEGRRLVTLIDALYESRAKLTVLAAEEPHQIFEDIESQDHQRTASRLDEMRDAAWIRGASKS